MEKQPYSELLFILPSRKNKDQRSSLLGDMKKFHKHYLNNKDYYNKILQLEKYEGKWYYRVNHSSIRLLMENEKIKRKGNKNKLKNIIIRDLYFSDKKKSHVKNMAATLKAYQKDLKQISEVSELVNEIKIREKSYFEIKANTNTELMNELKNHGFVRESYSEEKIVSKEEHATINEEVDHSLKSGYSVDNAMQPLGSMKPRKRLDNNKDYTLNSKTLGGNKKPTKQKIEVTLTDRNQKIVRYLKQIYLDTCQICGEKLEIAVNKFMSEVHHIQPLGKHNGADVIENMIVVCPNHHAMFDRGAITIDISINKVIHRNENNPIHNADIVLKHKINVEYINYHNENIFKKS